MKHKVTCMDCGKIERIEVERGKPDGGSNWWYYGKIKVNSCKTDKFFWATIDPTKGLFTEGNMKKVQNNCYDPSAKPKFAEMWSCPDCVKAERLKETETTKI